jgi:hypothetical protein
MLTIETCSRTYQRQQPDRPQTHEGRQGSLDVRVCHRRNSARLHVDMYRTTAECSRLLRTTDNMFPIWCTQILNPLVHILSQGCSQNFQFLGIDDGHFGRPAHHGRVCEAHRQACRLAGLLGAYQSGGKASVHGQCPCRDHRVLAEIALLPGYRSTTLSSRLAMHGVTSPHGLQTGSPEVTMRRDLFFQAYQCTQHRRRRVYRMYVCMAANLRPLRFCVIEFHMP